MGFQPPEQFNMADHFLDARVREGKGDRPAVLTDAGTLSYREIQALANRFGHVLTEAGVDPEQRVMIALPDGPSFVGALFGTLKIGAVVVMVNPELKPEAIAYFYSYTRAQVVVAHPRSEEHTSELQSQSNLVCRLLLEKKKKKPKRLNYILIAKAQNNICY